MANTRPVVASEEQRVALFWAEAPDVQQVLADEAILQYTGDRIYLSIGQIQMPPSAALAKSVESVEVVPVARLVFTHGSFHKLMGLLTKVADKIPKPDAPKGEGQR